MSDKKLIQAAYPAVIAVSSAGAIVSFSFAAPTYGPLIFAPLAVTIAVLGAGAVAWWKDYGRN